MANFSSLSDLLNTTDGMTVLRNNSAQDDGTDIIAGVDWFTFNGIVASSIYVNGNSWLGFGTASENLRVWRRDAKMYYLYRQEGTIGPSKFLKLRWEGYSYYNSTATAYSLKYEVFLFDDGGIYLNFFQVPGGSYTGTNRLTCGSNTYSFSVSDYTPVSYSFYSQDESTFLVMQEVYDVFVGYVSSGVAFFEILGIHAESIIESNISWTANIPEECSLVVSVSDDNEVYSPVINGGFIFEPGTGLETLHIKIEMETTDSTKSPSISNLSVTITDSHDKYSLILEMKPKERFESAAGAIMVQYNAALGNLMGEGGHVATFIESFIPQDLIPKPDQNDDERIEISNVTVLCSLMAIHYTDSNIGNEHISLTTITATGTLTNVNDI